MEYLRHNLKEVLRKIKAHRYIFLFLDYDGTLVEFEDTPEQAIPPERLKGLISKLASNDNLIITIVSGRTVGNLLEFFKDIDTRKLNWIGVHGAEVKYKNSGIRLSDEAKEAVPPVRDLKSKLAKLTRSIPCILLEDKKVSVALHYRKCSKKDLSRIPEFIDLIDNFVKGKPLDYLEMKKVIDVKPKNINKGSSIGIIRSEYKNLVPSINICIGDDMTDKYLFDSNSSGINIKVGAEGLEDLKADYYLKDVDDVYNFLKSIAGL